MSPFAIESSSIVKGVCFALVTDRLCTWRTSVKPGKESCKQPQRGGKDGGARERQRKRERATEGENEVQDARAIMHTFDRALFASSLPDESELLCF
jgi:hypothetical protein